MPTTEPEDPQEVAAQMVCDFVAGGTSVSVLAAHAGASVRVADLGVNYDFEPELPIFHKKVGKGTANFATQPAMSREQAIRAVEAGIEIVDQFGGRRQGRPARHRRHGYRQYHLLLGGHHRFLRVREVRKLTGRGTGIDDVALARKIEVIERALALHIPNPDAPLDVLTKVGGFEIGGLAGLVIGAAVHGIHQFLSITKAGMPTMVLSRRLCKGDAFTLSFSDQCPFELSEGTHHLKLQPSHRRIAVCIKGQAFLQKTNAHTLLIQPYQSCLPPANIRAELSC